MKKNILVVDDDAEVAMIIEEILKKKNYRVIIAQDGLRAIESSNAQKPDLILMDLLMPFFSGYWFCDAFKHRPVTRDVPIVVVSSLSAPEDIKKAYQVGASGYLKKPFGADELLEVVSKTMRI